MKKFSLELPKYRLQLHMKLIKRRKPLLAEPPLLPTKKLVKKKYRTGTFVGKIARHFSEHKKTRKVIVANLAAFVITGTFIPGVQAGSGSFADFSAQSDTTIIQAQNTLVTEKSIQYPLSNIRINQGFGLFHPGLDLGSPVGSAIKPIKAGNVIEAGYETSGYGNTIVIDHGQGLTSRYAHLSVIEVVNGQNVTTQDEIGKVGLTGHTTGPHLHLEISQNGIAINPSSVLSR